MPEAVIFELAAFGILACWVRTTGDEHIVVQAPGTAIEIARDAAATVRHGRLPVHGVVEGRGCCDSGVRLTRGARVGERDTASSPKRVIIGFNGVEIRRTRALPSLLNVRAAQAVNSSELVNG